MNKFNNKTIGLVGSLLILLCGCGNSHFEYKYYTNNDFYKDGVFQPDVDYIDISKAREMLGYSPV
ncbi:MAG: hypothetical protein HDR88_17125 [Bacteroides sp.]|nr:hypothetical protein [Bacteroides sp.]